MTLVEKWYRDDHHVCQNCQSENIEIMDLKIEDKRLYNFDELAVFYGPFLFAANLSKANNTLSLNLGGSRKIEKNFVKNALNMLLNTIKNREDSLFQSKPDGHFFICITGGINIHNSKEEINVQKLIHAGISKIEIADKIKYFATQNDISL
jgi:hypothetical protein